jgi:hypothetical protein
VRHVGSKRIAAEDPRAVARYLVDRVTRKAGPRWLQGSRTPPIPSSSAVPEVRLFAEHRLYKIGELESRALVGWAEGTRSAVLLDREAPVEEIVGLQAAGMRCVSLLDTDLERGVEFALHDLRHLEKLFDPQHHRAQIGFFRLLARVIGSEPWCAFDRELDEEWIAGRDYALADMNGSPIFLFAVLKMKLKMAVRRKLARDRGEAPPARGALDADEIEAFRATFERYLEVLGVPEQLRWPARMISARGNSGRAAEVFVESMERLAV